MSPIPTRATTPFVAVACALALAACATDPETPEALPSPLASTATSSGASPSASAPTGDSIDDRAEAILENVAGEPDWPLEGFGSIWALAPDQEEPAMLRLDPATNEIVASIPLPGQRCQGSTVTEDAIWACVTAGVVRIDPETNAITGEVPFETGQVWGRLAYGSGSVWAIGVEDGLPNQLIRIDPAAMTATAIPLGHGAVSLAYGFDAVWVTAPRTAWSCGSTPRPRKSPSTPPASSGRSRSWPGPDSLWVTLFGSEDLAPDEATVVRIDPTMGPPSPGSPPAPRRWARAACGRPTRPSGSVPPTRS